MSALLHDTSRFEASAQALVGVGQRAFAQGWVPAISGNFSSRLDDESIAITVSGTHKGFLSLDDIMMVDYRGLSLDGKQPSAETLLHTQLYQYDETIGTVLHTHSVSSTVLSRQQKGALVLEGIEVLKAFKGIDSQDAHLIIPVFEHDQDITRLSEKVMTWLASNDSTVPGYLIAGHGLYAWGDSVAETMRHLEAFEFLFQCELELRKTGLGKVEAGTLLSA